MVNFTPDSESSMDPAKIASAPDELRLSLDTAAEMVLQYFSGKTEQPENGSIVIHDERYILIKASSLSTEFFDLVSSHYHDRGAGEARRVAASMLYDIAHAVGKADARIFHEKMNCQDPFIRLSVGTVHFAHAGWGKVKLMPDYDLGENFFRLSFEHENSFEADSWLKAGRTSAYPVCVMNAGYSSGWVEESFGMPMSAVEITCRARGDEKCLFVMSSPDRIEEALNYYRLRMPPGHSPVQINFSDILVFFDRKRLEDELTQSRETAGALINATADGALLIAPDGRIEAVNIMAAQRLDTTPELLVGKNYFDLLPPAVAPNRLHLHRTVIQTGASLSLQEQINGLWFETHINPIKSQNGEVVRIALFSNDITRIKDSELELLKRRHYLEDLVRARTSDLESAYNKLLQAIEVRERAERELRDEKERLAVTLKSIGEGVIVSDIRGFVTSMNPSAEKITGRNASISRNRPIDEVLPLINLKSPQKEPVSVYLRMSSEYGPNTLENVGLKSGDQTGAEITCSISPMRDDHDVEIGYVVVFRDVTEEKRMEEELLRQKKIESLAILAGGLAHDFNNLLTGILGNISLVKLDMPRGDGHYKRLEACETAGLRAQKLTQQLLTFSRGGEPVKRVARLERVIRESVDFAMSGSPVAVIYRFADNVLPVEVDEGQISQVFHNLAINAVHAMPGGGNLDISMRNADPAHLRPPMSGRSCVEIIVADQGVGIPREHLSKVFDPYFTTRENGKGLGLTSVYTIIKRHDGHIRLESETGVGTTFYIYLPASSASPEPGEKPEKKSRANMQGRILLMDDEAIIRQVAGDILRSLGYQVDMAEHGMQALEMFQKEFDAGRPYDLVIMDLTIPGGMGGKEATQILLSRFPQAKILVSSGYSTDPAMSEYQKYGFLGVISKPYRIAEMAAILESVLKA